MKVKLLKKIRDSFYIVYETDFYFQWAAYEQQPNHIILRSVTSWGLIRKILEHMYGHRKAKRLLLGKYPKQKK